jgi:hypothetical protein
MTKHPDLPEGYQAQPAWGFRDPTRGITYEFHRVYSPVDRLDRRGPTSQLDQALSYWEELPAGRWLTFAQAQRRSPRLKFDSFSTARWMRAHGNDHQEVPNDNPKS